VARQILSVFKDQRVCLMVDTTKVGFNHRRLVIGLAYRHRTLPLVWSVHEGARGHTTLEAQLALFQQVAALLPPGADVMVLSDTEFQHVPCCASSVAGSSTSLFVNKSGSRSMSRGKDGDIW